MTKETNYSSFGGPNYQKQEGQILAATLERAYRVSDIPFKFPRPKTTREQNPDNPLLPQITPTRPDLAEFLPGIELITRRLLDRGLVYDGTPFNFGLYVATWDKGPADEICRLSTKFLQALNQLRRSNRTVRQLLDGGLNQFTRRLANKDSLGNTPFIRIDVINNRIIELGPNYVDGFATAQVLSESFGISSRCTEEFAITIQQNYLEFCQRRNIPPKKKPYLLFTYSPDTSLMADELITTAEYLQSTNILFPVVEQMKARIGKPDIIYFYGKPSMWEWDGQTPKPFATGLLDLAATGKTLILPSLNQSLGSKSALALLFEPKYQKFFIATLGTTDYQRLCQLVAPTRVIRSTQDAIQALSQTALPAVIKPSNQGSNDGVSVINSLSDLDRLNIQWGEEPWLVQEYQEQKPIPSLIGLRSSRGSKKSQIVQYQSPFSRTVLLATGEKCAGGFITFDTSPIIDDSGLNVPIKILNKPLP